MAEKFSKPESPGFHSQFGWLLWGLVLLGFIWFFTGGTQSETAHEGAYLEPPQPLDGGRAYGTYYEGEDSKQTETLNLPRAPGNFLREVSLLIGDTFSGIKEVRDTRVTPLLGKKIYLGDTVEAKAKNPDEEYLRIEIDPYTKNAQNISGLVLRGTGFNTSIIIPKAINLPVLGTSPAKTDVIIPPGGHAIITSGRSPIGTSFRMNKCAGYLDQFQNYVPDLNRNCPYPSDELKAYGPYRETSCAEFVEKIPRCKIFQDAPAKTLSNICVDFLAEKLNYNACVADHKNDKDFYSNEWRLFLNQSNELWKNSDEIIRLMDAEGAVLDAVTY
ncbi:MAG: hypothetical protein Q7R72_00775 [bacterium]|nr:hypothetical protein [bacterium]